MAFGFSVISLCFETLQPNVKMKVFFPFRKQCGFKQTQKLILISNFCKQILSSLKSLHSCLWG